MSEQILRNHHAVWRKKPILRSIYSEWYQQVTAALVSGKTLEIGGGTGNFKELYPDVITTDIVFLPWLDVVLDAHRLPYKNESLANVVLLDVLHHLENPVQFFQELHRVLTPGGRAHFFEPYISPFSYPVYHWLHPEPVDFAQDPFEIQASRGNRKPFDANQAVPYLIFFRNYRRFKWTFSGFSLKRRIRMSFWAYPLSGGFDHPCFIPERILNKILKIEKLFSFLSPILAFRMFVVLEKKTQCLLI